MRTALVVLLLVGCALALAATTEQGPTQFLTLWRRYRSLSLLPIVGLALVVLAWLYPGPAQWALGASVAVSIWRRRQLGLWLKRGALKARWASVVRSSGLGVTNDRRSNEWPGGSIVKVTSERIEYLPTIRWGRKTGPSSAVWKLSPGRGQKIANVAEKSEELAAAFGVTRVVVTRVQPYKGLIEVYW